MPPCLKARGIEVNNMSYKAIRRIKYLPILALLLFFAAALTVYYLMWQWL